MEGLKSCDSGQSFVLLTIHHCQNFQTVVHLFKYFLKALTMPGTQPV